MHVERIEMLVARGAQKHTLRHILAPEPHRLTDDDMFNVVVRRLSGNCQSERSGPDDQNVSFHGCASLAGSKLTA